jgi:hypothetical protein
VVWDGRPSLESCDVGRTTLGGRASPRTEWLYVTVRPAMRATGRKLTLKAARRK